MVERTAPSTPGSRAIDSEAASDLAARSSNCRTVRIAPAGFRSGSACPSRSLTRKLLIAWARARAASAAPRSRSIRARDWPSRTVLTARTTTAVWSSPAPMATAGAVLARPAGQPHRRRGAVHRDRLVGRPPLDVVLQGQTGWVSLLGPRRHRLQADRLQRRIDARVELAGPRELAASDLAEHLADVALEGGLAGQQAVEGGAQAVDVAAGPEVDPARRRPARGSCRRGCPGRCRARSRHCRWPRRASATARRRRRAPRTSPRAAWRGPNRPPASRRACRR